MLKPGFFATGTIDTKIDEGVMAAPDDAVSTLSGVSTVYVVEGGKARQQVVTLGVHQGKSWEILDGLKGDEKLAASNLNQLATGTAVQVGGQSAGSEGGGQRGSGTARGERAEGRQQGDTP